MSTTSSTGRGAVTSEHTVRPYAVAGGSVRSNSSCNGPKKLPKSLVEFWASKPAAAGATTAVGNGDAPPAMTTDSSSVAASSSNTATTATSKKLRMVFNGRYNSKRELQPPTTPFVEVGRSAEYSTTPSQDDEETHYSPLGQQRLFDSRTTCSSVSSHDTSRQKSSLDPRRPAVQQPEQAPAPQYSDEVEAEAPTDNTIDTSALTPSIDKTQQQGRHDQPPKRAFVFVSGDYNEDDDPFATPAHSTHRNHCGNISVASPLYAVDQSTLLDSQQQQAHISWVWDGETQEIHHHRHSTTVLDETTCSSTDIRIRDVLHTTLNTNNNDQVGSVDSEKLQTSVCGSKQSQTTDDSLETDMDLPGKAMLTDDETETTYGPKIPEGGRSGGRNETMAFVPSDYVMANVVNAANAAIQSGSDHFSDMSNGSFPVTIHQDNKPAVAMDDSPSRTKDRHNSNWTAIVQSPSQADVNRSDFSEGIMANIISVANAAIQGKADQSTDNSTDTRSRAKHLEIGETPLRSNRQEDCSDAWKRLSPQKPLRSSPPSRRIMNASPQPPSPQSSPLAMRRTLSKGDSKPSIKNDDMDVSFHDDEEEDDDDESTSASSAFRDDTPGVNFDRLFSALIDFVNPSDDQSSVDTMSTMSRRWQPSFDMASLQDASRASTSPQQVRPDSSTSAFLDIRSWWTQETQTKKTAPLPSAKATEIHTNHAADVPWLNKLQASMFEQRNSKTNGRAKEWESKPYLDATSFDALEEIATALRHKKNTKPAGSSQTAQDKLSEQFLSLFERLRVGKETAEMNSSRNSDDGIEVTIDDSGRPEILPEETEQVSLIHTFTKEPTTMNSGDDRSALPGTARSLQSHNFTFRSIPFEGHKHERRTHSLSATSAVLRARSGLQRTRTDFSLSEYIAKDERFSTPENSMLIHNEDRSLSPILGVAESPLQIRAGFTSKSGKSCDDDYADLHDDVFSRQRLACQTSTRQASIEEQLRDLYTVVRHHRSAIIFAETSADIRDTPSEEREDTIYRTPSPKKTKSCNHPGAGGLTPLTADETDTSPESGPKPHNTQSKGRRRAHKISITTLSGGESRSMTRNQASPEVGTNIFACSLQAPILPNDMTFGQDPIWTMRSVSVSSPRNSLGTSYESDYGLTRLGHEQTFVPNERPDNKTNASPKRRNLMRKNRSSYSIMDDETVTSNNISNEISHSSVYLGASPPKETPLMSLLDVVAPLPSDVTRGSSCVSLDNTNQTDSSAQKQGSSPRSRKPLFGRQLSLSWLKRPNKHKASYWKKGSILDEESDFNNDTTHDSSLTGIELGKETAPAHTISKQTNLDGSMEVSFYGTSVNGYSVESQNSPREWTTPPKRSVVPRQTKATWRPSLQGQDDAWEEVVGPRAETKTSSGASPRSQSFKPQTSLRMIHRHSTSPVRRTANKGNTNLRSVSPSVRIESSLLARSSSVPNIRGNGRSPLPKTTTMSPQFQARPTVDIAWAPPQQVTVNKPQRQQPHAMMMNTSSSSSEDSSTVPPAASWEEFNGFTSGFWQAQEI